MHICGTQKNGTGEQVCRAEIETQTQRTTVWSPRAESGGGSGGGGMYWEIGIDIYTVICIKQISKRSCQGFPGGAVVENLPTNAGDTGSSPGLGRSHIQRSDQAREPQLLGLRIWSLCSATKRGHDSERPAHRNEKWPPLAATRESPRTETKTQHSQK